MTGKDPAYREVKFRLPTGHVDMLDAMAARRNIDRTALLIRLIERAQAGETQTRSRQVTPRPKKS